MSLSLLFSIPGVIAIMILAYQNRFEIRNWFYSMKEDIFFWTKNTFGTFHFIDDSLIFDQNLNGYSSVMFNSGFTSWASINGSMPGTISAAAGADLVFSNSQYNVSLSQLGNALNELRSVRQELCEYKVKFGTKLYQLELLLKEKEL